MMARSVVKCTRPSTLHRRKVGLPIRMAHAYPLWLHNLLKALIRSTEVQRLAQVTTGLISGVQQFILILITVFTGVRCLHLVGYSNRDGNIVWWAIPGA